jgi:hypothetical protein
MKGAHRGTDLQEFPAQTFEIVNFGRAIVFATRLARGFGPTLAFEFTIRWHFICWFDGDVEIPEHNAWPRAVQ